MDEQTLRNLLLALQRGELDLDSMVERIRSLPMETLPSARLDHHRSLRTGMPEAIFGENKTSTQLIEILSAQLRQPHVVLATRIAREKAEEVLRKVAGLRYHEQARMLSGNEGQIRHPHDSREILIISAGTSDIPVAEEARVTLECLGRRVTPIYDAGVAGLHRVLAHESRIRQAAVILVVAGMEGALPSVVAGITPAPVIGVPTSIGYGTGAGGFSALLGMLNSCAPGLAVVNIDNGFGAACMAAAITHNESTSSAN